jgi:defect-in-organelle-trafficking protein DotD
MLQKFSCLFNVIMFGILGLSLSACAVNRPAPQYVAEPDEINLRLADAADRASNAIEMLASIEQSKIPDDQEIKPITNAPPELRRIITLDWVGPIEPVTERLANRAGYEFNVVGETPSIPIVVTVKSVEDRVIDILRSVGLQAGKRAKLIVDANAKLIELAYVPITAR